MVSILKGELIPTSVLLKPKAALSIIQVLSKTTGGRKPVNTEYQKEGKQDLFSNPKLGPKLLPQKGICFLLPSLNCLL